MGKIRRIYLDYAATTPLDPAVLKAMKPYLSAEFGNPGSLHSFGQKATAAVDGAREAAARVIGAGFREVIFTGSATEANNLALKGVLKSARNRGLSKIIVSSVEHDAVIKTVEGIAGDGFEVVRLSVDREGSVDLREFEKALDGRTALVSVMYVNNETGTVEPVREMGEIVKKLRTKNHSAYPFFHTDAVQAFQFFDCDVRYLGVDMLTLSAHKIYGPKGIGLLYANDAVQKELRPIITGGGQEFGFRSGTENVAAIVGFGKALEIAFRKREISVKAVLGFKEGFLAALRKIRPDLAVNGPANDKVSPHILNVYFPGFFSSELLVKFDIAGLAVSAGSACGARATRRSHVLEAIGLAPERIDGSVRFSFGRFLSKEDITRAAGIARWVLA
jgi:cysteine desulfurase